MNPIGKPPTAAPVIAPAQPPVEQLMQVVLGRVSLPPNDFLALVTTVAAIPPQVAHRSRLALLNGAQAALVAAGYHFTQGERGALKALLDAAFAAVPGRMPNSSN